MDCYLAQMTRRNIFPYCGINKPSHGRIRRDFQPDITSLLMPNMAVFIDNVIGKNRGNLGFHRFTLGAFSTSPQATKNRCSSNRGLYSLNSSKKASAVWIARVTLSTLGLTKPFCCHPLQTGQSLVQLPPRILFTISAARMKCCLVISCLLEQNHNIILFKFTIFIGNNVAGDVVVFSHKSHSPLSMRRWPV